MNSSSSYACDYRCSYAFYCRYSCTDCATSPTRCDFDDDLYDGLPLDYRPRRRYIYCYATDRWFVYPRRHRYPRPDRTSDRSSCERRPYGPVLDAGVFRRSLTYDPRYDGNTEGLRWWWRRSGCDGYGGDVSCSLRVRLLPPCDWDDYATCCGCYRRHPRRRPRFDWFSSSLRCGVERSTKRFS